MGNSIQECIVNILADEITSISPTDLEKISCRLVEQITGEKMQEFGVNSNGRPVSGTVDGTSDNSSIIYECSTEKNYFTDKNFKKISKDIDHAIKYSKAPHGLKIFLISSQKEPVKFREKFNAYKSQKYSQYDISIYAAVKIADLIFESILENAQAMDFYQVFFPRFALEMDKYTYYGTPPRHCERYVSNELGLASIEDHFTKCPICILYGLSGAGKTELSKEFSLLQIEKGMNCLWITGDDWKENKSFRDIKGGRGGNSINVAGIFNSHKTLLVIDDLKRKINNNDFEELDDGLRIGSQILVTSQFYNIGVEYYLKIPKLSIDSLMQILGESEDTISNNGRFVLQKCMSLPLILSTIYNMVDKIGIEREEIYINILNHIEDLKDGEGKSVIKRILSNLAESDYRALEKIANSKIYMYEAKLLKKFIRPICFLIYTIFLLFRTIVYLVFSSS